MSLTSAPEKLPEKKVSPPGEGLSAPDGKLPRSLVNALITGGAMALFVVWDQWYWWNTREDYSFGFLVPFFVAYVVFDRWGTIRGLLAGRGRASASKGLNEGNDASCEAEPPGDRESHSDRFGNVFFYFLGFALLAAGLFLFFTGAFYRAGAGPSTPSSLLVAIGFGSIFLPLVFFHIPERIPNPDTPAGASLPVRLFYDTRFQITALFLFPAFIWVISAPLVSFVETNLNLFLLAQVTKIVFFVFDMTGFPLEQQGNLLILPTGVVGVAEACSGIRSLTACLFAGSFLGAVFLNAFWKKILLVSLAMCFAFFTNILRSLFLTGWAYAHGPDAIEGAVHDATGYAVLGLTSIGLLLILPLFHLHLDYEDDEDAEVTETTPDPRKRD
ncbi:MAG: exosortase/archaeosortase family protein [Opitutales bacterium]